MAEHEDSTTHQQASKLQHRRQIVGGFLAFSGSLLVKGNALASAPLDAISDTDLTNKLKPATSDQPRVPLPTKGTKENTLEGQIALNDPTSATLRPTASDIILLTVRSVNDPDKVIAGASLPVSRIPSFPVRFLLNEKNAMSIADGSNDSSRRAWRNAIENSDMIVEAVVCSRSTVDEKRSAGDSLLKMKGICTATNGSTLGGQGFAKVLRLNTEQTGSEPIIIRAPVSVVLY